MLMILEICHRSNITYNKKLVHEYLFSLIDLFFFKSYLRLEV